MDFNAGDRPFAGRLRQPVKLGVGDTGTVFEIADDDFAGIFDEEEELFDDDLMVDINWDLGNRKNLLPLDKDMKFERQQQLFGHQQYLKRDFKDIEAEGMESLVDDGTVKKIVLRPGIGVKVEDRSKIFYNYMAIAEGGEEPFDATLVRSRPQVTDLRREELLPGILVAVTSMEVGEVSRFIIYPEMAYGDQGCAPRIPKNTKLLYVIEILQAIGEKTLMTPLYMTAEERAALPFAEILKESQRYQMEGNKYFYGNSFQEAIKMWRRGITFLEEYPVDNDEDGKERDNVLWKCYSNIAQAYLELNKAPQACNACKAGLRSASGEIAAKLYFRFAKAKLMLSDAEAALRIVKDALKLAGNGTPLKADLLQLKQKVECEAERKKQNESYKGMCKNMFGKSEKADGKENKNPPAEAIASSSNNSPSSSSFPPVAAVEITTSRVADESEGASAVAAPSPVQGEESEMTKASRLAEILERFDDEYVPPNAFQNPREEIDDVVEGLFDMDLITLSR